MGQTGKNLPLGLGIGLILALPLVGSLDQRLAQAQELNRQRNLETQLASSQYLTRCLTGWVLRRRLGFAACQNLLATSRTQGDRLLEVQALLNLGRIYKVDRQENRALETYQQALKLAQAGGDRLLSQGLTPAAQQFLSRQPGLQAAQQQFQQWRDRQFPALQQELLIEIGDVYLRQGKAAEAEAAFQQALAIAKQLGDPNQQALNLNKIGTVYLDQDQPDQAFQYFRLRDQQWGQSSALDQAIQQGELGLHKRQYAQVVATLEPWLKQGPETAIREELHLYLSQAYFGLGQYAKALQALQRVPDASLELAQIYFQLGQYAQAEANLKQAAATAETNLATIQTQIQQAEGRSDARLSRLESRNQQNPLAQALPPEAAAELRRQQAALTEFRQQSRATASGTIDLLGIQLWDGRTATIYDLLQRTLVAQKQFPAALEVAERQRARILANQLARQFELETQIVAPTRSQIQQLARDQQATLVSYSLVRDAAEVDLDKAAIVELLIWVIQPSGTISFRQVDLRRLDQPLDKLVRSALATASTGRSGQALQQLHQLLIAPIADLLPQNPNDRLVLIPDGALFLVPFAALQDAQGQYLIERHAIAISPSLQVLQLIQQRPQLSGPTTALVVGNPVMPNYAPVLGDPPQPLSPLPFATREAQAIAQMLGVQPLMGDRATKAAVKQQLPQARIIHLATHGEFDPQDGLSSWLALAPTPEEDGIFTASDIWAAFAAPGATPLQADLVVLSACVTGRGPITGDGVVGLSRSFLAAGAASLVASLWYVPDESTSLLMQAFYQQRQQRLNKAQALRQAMLSLLKQPQTAAPKNWAGFMLIGDSR